MVTCLKVIQSGSGWEWGGSTQGTQENCQVPGPCSFFWSRRISLQKFRKICHKWTQMVVLSFQKKTFLKLQIGRIMDQKDVPSVSLHLSRCKARYVQGIFRCPFVMVLPQREFWSSVWTKILYCITVVAHIWALWYFQHKLHTKRCYYCTEERREKREWEYQCLYIPALANCFFQQPALLWIYPRRAEAEVWFRQHMQTKWEKTLLLIVQFHREVSKSAHQIFIN